MLTAQQAAAYLGLHVNTLKKLPLVFIRISKRGDRRYRKADLEQFIASREVRNA